MSYFKTTIGLFLSVAILGITQSAQSFSLNEGISLNDTERWDRNDYKKRGLAGKLEWNFENDFLTRLDFAEGNITDAQLTQAITNAFNIWETVAKNDPKISDLVAFTQKGTAIETFLSEGSEVDFNRAFQGSEISLFSRPQDAQLVRQPNQSENIFMEGEIGKTITTFFTKKPISTATNKVHNVGATIIDADIYINSSESWTLQPKVNTDAQDFVALLAHEIGHSLGLGHPGEDTYFDTDDNPNNRILIDPLQPENSTDLEEKNNPDRDNFTPLAIMIPDSAVSQLANDDLSGLNYLYPECPEPTSKLSPQSQLQLQADTSSTSLGCLDYGDAPNSYQTLLSSDGPRYQEGELQLLGYLWDNEKDGQPSPGADLDDKNGSCSNNICFPPDDEDGVIFGDSWVDVIFNIERPGANEYQLRAWWDRAPKNGVFDHTSELYIDDLLTLEPGITTKRYDLGFDPKEDGLYSRFRLTWNPLDPDVKPFGEYFSNADCTLADAAAGNCISHGEVEDYVHTPEPTSTIGILALGILGGGATLKRKLKPSNSTEKETTKVC